MFDILSTMLLMGAPQEGAGGGSMISMLIMFGGVILVMYFLMIRPQQKRQKEHQKMLEGVKKGDKVVTTAGIHGTVTEVSEKTFVLQMADNVKVTFEKSAIASKN